MNKILCYDCLILYMVIEVNGIVGFKRICPNKLKAVNDNFKVRIEVLEKK